MRREEGKNAKEARRRKRIARGVGPFFFSFFAFASRPLRLRGRI
jgi:hypothetical protein